MVTGSKKYLKYQASRAQYEWETQRLQEMLPTYSSLIPQQGKVYFNPLIATYLSFKTASQYIDSGIDAILVLDNLVKTCRREVSTEMWSATEE